MAILFKKEPESDETIRRILNLIVAKWFYSCFKELSLPQRYAVLDIHSRKNVLISAPTGATKTLTAFLSILNELVDSAMKGILEDRVYCVYVSPLKALNNDIQRNLLEPLKSMENIYGKDLGIRVMVRTGDTSTKDRSQMLKNPPHILITTPESLGIVLSSVKFREHLRNVDWFIADEIHALADNKRGVHLSLSMERLSDMAGHMARIGLSATVAPLEEVAHYLAGERDCTIVDATFEKKMDLKVISPVPDLINVTHQELHSKLYERMHALMQEHKTTLVFTNTRAATERVVDFLKDKYPRHYGENIGAHHGSLSTESRTLLESRLKSGELKVVVCSTSLELGIDIGYIDLVICLGSPKSVARALQRIGRSGHRPDAVTKGRIIVMDRDDLVECAVLLKAAIEKKIDRIDIPKNALDVLAQHIYGLAIADVWDENQLYALIKKSYCYNDLPRKDFDDILSYLAGEYAQLEDRNVYAKIWRKEGRIGGRGKLARVIYMTNIGTIPDQSQVIVKVGNAAVGSIDEGFLERLRPGDIFVLGGARYMFRYSKGMSAYVSTSVDRPPTIPSWVSEMLPLSFDLAKEIGRFRRLIEERLRSHVSSEEVIRFINDYLYLDENSAKAIYLYISEQYNYAGDVPSDKKVLIEHYLEDADKRKIVFHTLFGRRVNDVLSRAIAFAITRSQHKEVEIAINDNGFYLGVSKDVKIDMAFRLVNSEDLTKIMGNAIEGSEILKRRFRHCAGRSLMILRNYMGKTKRVGRQQVSSMLLLSAVKRISDDFPILREARREVLCDQMDLLNAQVVLKDIEDGKIDIQHITTSIPSPFAFNIVLRGVMDIIKMEDKMAFLQRMHQMVLAKISLKKGPEIKKSFDYYREWAQEEMQHEDRLAEKKFTMKLAASGIDAPGYVKDAIIGLIEGDEQLRGNVASWLRNASGRIKKDWPKDLADLVLAKIEEMRA